MERRVTVVVLHLGAGFVMQEQQLPKEKGEQVSTGRPATPTHASSGSVARSLTAEPTPSHRQPCGPTLQSKFYHPSHPSLQNAERLKNKAHSPTLLPRSHREASSRHRRVSSSGSTGRCRGLGHTAHPVRLGKSRGARQERGREVDMRSWARLSTRRGWHPCSP